MGRRGRSRTQRKHFSQSRENTWKSSNNGSEQQENATTDNNNNRENSNLTWKPIAIQNLAFEEYYKEQMIVAPEEWDTFMDCLRSPLPASFRINSSSQCYLEIRSKLEYDFMKSLQEEGSEGAEAEAEAISPLPWYPENLGWQSIYSRKQLRKNETLERFHEFLKLQNEIGNITRQEAVSMVPPLFLDVRPDDFVLDMCAAPGSKTFQLLEMIHCSAQPGSLPGGMVLANDADVQRCNLLIHQTKRMSTANLVVTNHEAQHFPSCHLKRCYDANGSQTREVKELDIDQLLFDRVLCDVPCSGDGTLRKAPDIWRRWNAGMGNGLHGLQIQIAMRGMSLLKVGGRMVYSTCSMNPLENEAVVAEVLRRCEGSIELVDVSSELPQLVRRPGLKKWKVQDKGTWLASYREVHSARRAAFVPGMFPSGKAYVDAPELADDAGRSQLPDNNSNGDSQNGIRNLSLDEEVSTLPLERCVRIVPHDQNTGAFFIAVFHKLSPLPVIQKKPIGQPGKTASRGNFQVQSFTEFKDITADEVEATIDNAGLHENGKDEAHLDTDPSKTVEEKSPEQIEPSNDGRAGPELVRGKRKSQMRGRWRGIDPVVFYREEAVVSQIKAFYGINKSFPFEGHLISRNSDIDHVKRVYYVSKSVKQVLELNFLAGQQLKIAAVGLKMFERQKSKDGASSTCMFRITSEGLPLLLPHITKQIVYASPVDFKNLLQHKSVKFADFADADFREKASKLLFGCCVVVLNKDNTSFLSEPRVDASTIAIGCWRGRNSITMMVAELDCQELLERMSMYTEEKPLTGEADKIGKADEAELNILKNETS